MSGAKLSSVLQPDSEPVQASHRDPFGGLLNLTGKNRKWFHLLFWVCFLAYHLLYFLPAISTQELEPELWISYTVYYLRFIPVFYFSLYLFDKAQPRVSGLWLLALMFAILVASMHLVSTLVYLGLDQVYGLDQLSPAFKTLGGMYVKPIADRVPSDWFVFIYDMQEIQLLILPVGIKMVQFGLRHQIAQSEMEKEALRRELAILKSELEPHFVYNVLNSAYAKILPVSKVAASYLEQLSRLLRYTLYETAGDWVPLSREISGLKRYLQLERLRHGRRFTVQWKQDGLLNSRLSIPTLLLITLGENAVKHGVRARSGKTVIKVDIRVESDVLTFEIENETAQASAKKPQGTSAGIGLKNVQRRLQILYPGRHSVQITEQAGKYQVRICIPMARPATK